MQTNYAKERAKSNWAKEPSKRTEQKSKPSKQTKRKSKHINCQSKQTEQKSKPNTQTKQSTTQSNKDQAKQTKQQNREQKWAVFGVDIVNLRISLHDLELLRSVNVDVSVLAVHISPCSFLTNLVRRSFKFFEACYPSSELSSASWQILSRFWRAEVVRDRDPREGLGFAKTLNRPHTSFSKIDTPWRWNTGSGVPTLVNQ